jgi:hypothetical protein
VICYLGYPVVLIFEEIKRGLQEIHSIAEIAAVIAVFGSLVFVGIQLRRGNVATLASNGQAAVNKWNQLSLVLATDERLNGVQMKTLHPDLDKFIEWDSDQNRLMYFMTAGKKVIEGHFLQWQAGNLTDDMWHGFSASLVEMFTYNTCWNDYREMQQHLHTDSFGKLVNDSIQAAELHRRELIKAFTET